jgi:hypothetical protein
VDAIAIRFNPFELSSNSGNFQHSIIPMQR